jgi:hypothetical protein
MSPDLVTIHITDLAPVERSDQWHMELNDAFSRIALLFGVNGADLPLEIFDRRGAKIGTLEWSSEAFLMRKAG